MVCWAEFAEAEPTMAATGVALMEKFHIAYLATVRADGSPRVHPVSPFIIDGRLFVATPQGSPKARDQLRDGRYVIHMLPGKDDAEFRIRGRAGAVTDASTRAMVLERGPHYVKEHDHIFEYDIDEAAMAYWENVGQPGTYAVRRSWRAAS